MHFFCCSEDKLNWKNVEEKDVFSTQQDLYTIISPDYHNLMKKLQTWRKRIVKQQFTLTYCFRFDPFWHLKAVKKKYLKSHSFSLKLNDFSSWSGSILSILFLWRYKIWTVLHVRFKKLPRPAPIKKKFCILQSALSPTGWRKWNRPRYPTLTFPDKDLSIRAVVQNKAVAGLQGALGKGVLCCHKSDGHSSAGVRHLQEGIKLKFKIQKHKVVQAKLPPSGPFNLLIIINMLVFTVLIVCFHYSV